ncbi:hypothetical protein MPSEU_000882400 [Mayamaea pseudoterrestris]|nr:hypothetical protein MPSEU_000882400 [Mayamaea pseudoterrestris]
MTKNSEKKRRKKENRRRRQVDEERKREFPQTQRQPSPSPSCSDSKVVAAASDTIHEIKTPSLAPFAARKRQLSSISFVYPAERQPPLQQQQSKRYAFGTFQPMSAASSTTTSLFEDESSRFRSLSSLNSDNEEIKPSNCCNGNTESKTESIQDILFGSKPKRSKLDSPTAADENTKSTSKMKDSRLQQHAMQSHISNQTVDQAIRDRQGLRPRANSTDGELMLPQRGLCDEREVLAAHAWNLQKHTLGKNPKGLMNLGNTCFLNSTLQCLAYLPPFCQTLMALPELDYNGASPKMSQGRKVTYLLRSLFRRMHDHANSHSAVAPRTIVNALSILGSIGKRNGGGYRFRPGRQEDAHEFLVHLLDAMNDGELREAGIQQERSGWRDRLPVPRLDETTLLRRIFGGYFRNEVKCTQCSKKSKTYDPFLDLSLEVSRKACNSLDDAIREFTRKETLDSENRWKCPGCNKRVCAVKQLTVFRPPLALCIQLKRFSFGGGMSFGSGFKKRFGGGNMKITRPIEFPAHFELPLSDGRSCGYALTGVVIHVGGSANSGHYTAYVKRPAEIGFGSWFHMDDSYVQQVSENTVLRQRDAYVLFYCRREVRLEFPSPPLRSSMTADEATKLGRAKSRARAESIDNTTTAAPEHANLSNFAEAPAAGNQQNEVKENPLSKPSSTTELRTTKPCADNFLKQSRPSVYDDRRNSGKSSSDSDESDASSAAEMLTPSKREETNHSDANDPAKSPVANDTEAQQPHSSSKIKVNSIDMIMPATESSPANLSHLQHQKSPSLTTKTRIIVDRGAGREKIEVMLGPRRNTKAWRPDASSFAGKDEEYSLLGTQRVNGWSNESELSHGDATKDKEERKHLVASMERAENKRKRQQFLDRWDAALDTGKNKKVKARKDPFTATDPKDNVFQKLQSDVVNMFGHQSKNNNKSPFTFKTKKSLKKSSR